MLTRHLYLSHGFSRDFHSFHHFLTLLEGKLPSKQLARRRSPLNRRQARPFGAFAAFFC